VKLLGVSVLSVVRGSLNRRGMKSVKKMSDNNLKSLTIRNNGSHTIYLGGSELYEFAAENGWPLEPGGTICFSRDTKDDPEINTDIYARTKDGKECSVKVLEEKFDE